MTQVTLGNGVVDSSAGMKLRTNGSTEAVDISTGQVATLAQNPILTSGTANGVAYLNGSKVVTSGSGFVFDGTNVGIGVTNPGNKLALPNNAFISFRNTSAAEAGYIGMTSGNLMSYSDKFYTDSSGNLLVGTTTAGALLTVDKTSGGTSSNKIAVYGYGSGLGYGAVFQPNTNTGASPCRFLNAAGTEVGSIGTTASATTYATSSDYRLKENIQPMTDALSVVGALKPCTYTWKADGSDGQGFIAHELQAVVPDCVIGEKDAVDADGNPKYQGIDTSFLVATLTAAIKEQQALISSQAAAITSLTERIAALEAK